MKMIKSGQYFKITLLLLLVCPGIFAQTKDSWVEIPLADTMAYTVFGTEHIPDSRYPPGHLFDAGFATCWVSRMPDDNTYPSVFFAVPKDLTDNAMLNIFSGYGKSESLFLKNSRPGKVQISLATALVPDGYVSEYGMLCKVLPSPYQETVFLADTFGVQTISLQNYQKFMPYHHKALSRYQSSFPFPAVDTFVLVEMKILSVHQGTVYDDICISEIFFNDCYIPSEGKAFDRHITSVYVSEDENILLVDTEEQNAVAVYDGNGSILQIIEITGDNRWAIVISMPGEAPGRVETQYLIIDLMNGEDISHKIENLIPEYTAGEPVYFESENERNYLVIQGSPDVLPRIELRHYQ
ncbi:MAG: hypothetical protein R6U78_06580 [Bacteroidales bacterium]